MPTKEDELLYEEVQKWIKKNQDNEFLPEEIKRDILNFNTLSEEKKDKLLLSLRNLPEEANIPHEITNRLFSDFEALPNEMLSLIKSHLTELDLKNLSFTSKKMYYFFRPYTLINF